MTKHRREAAIMVSAIGLRLADAIIDAIDEDSANRRKQRISSPSVVAAYTDASNDPRHTVRLAGVFDRHRRTATLRPERPAATAAAT